MRAWLRSISRRDELEDRLDEELSFHLDQLIDKHERAGLSSREARRHALIELGGVELSKERTRDEFRGARFEAFIRDLRHAVRALLRSPRFAIVPILTLALGIGATTAMFSIVNGVVMRPLPYPNQDRLVELTHEAPGFGIDELYASPAIYFTYRDRSTTFETVGLWDWDASPVTVTGRGDPEAVSCVEVTREVLVLLGARPRAGRLFTAGDDQPGAEPTVIVSQAYAERRMGGIDPLEQYLTVDGTPRRVIGVLPRSFDFFDYPADLFYPLQLDRAQAEFPSFDGRGLALVKPGVTLADANADVARMIPLLNEEFSQGGFENARFGPRLRWLKDMVVGDLSETLWLLMATIGLLLLISCANVASLVLVRTEARRHELSLRTALGAGRAAITRVVFAESLIIGGCGGLLGIAVAASCLPALLAVGRGDLPQVMAVTIDPVVLLISVVSTLAATVLFGLVPALSLVINRQPLSRALSGVREGTAPAQGRLRQLLVVAQVALALLLLIGSGLMARTFQSLRQVDPGFVDPERALTFQLTIPRTADPETDDGWERELRVRQTIVDRLDSVSGVDSVGFTSFNDGLPLDGDGRATGVIAESRVGSEGAAATRQVQFASPRVLQSLGTQVVAGRSFDWTDVYERREVALVSENMARAEWGAVDQALGKRLGRSASGPWSEVVGIVQDIRHDGLSVPAPHVVVFPAVPSSTMSFVVRSERVGQADFYEEIQQAVWDVNPGLSMAAVRTLGDLYEQSLARVTVTLQLLATTGALALFLGLVGIYGVVSYAISRQQREIGIRLALGAPLGRVRRSFARQALALVAIGSIVGLLLSTLLTRLMSSQLFGVSPLDPLTHVVVVLGLVIVAGSTAYLSARRASALDPIEAVRRD